jgi:hypothetical protein
MVIKIKSKTFKNNQYQSREESKTTILLDKALVEATKKVQRTIRTTRVFVLIIFIFFTLYINNHRLFCTHGD